MRMIQLESRGFRLKVGCEAWSSPDMTNKDLAAKHEITADAVADCKKEATELHKHLSFMFGHRYFTDGDFGRKPEGMFCSFGIGHPWNRREG